MKKNLLLIVLLALMYSHGYTQTEKWTESFIQESLIVEDPPILHMELPKATDDSSRIEWMNSIGNYYKFRRPDSGIYYGNKSLAVSRRIGFLRGELIALNNLALSYRTLGNYSKALRIRLDGLRIAEESKIKDLEALYLVNVAQVHFLHGSYNESLRSSKKAYHLFDSLGSRYLLVIAGSRMGSAFLALGQVDSALFFIHRAYNQARPQINSTIIRLPLRELGQIHDQIGNIDSALYYWRKAFKSSTDTRTGVSLNALSIAKLYWALQEKDSVVFYAEQSLKAAIGGSLYSDITDAYLFLAEINESEDPVQALKYTKLAIIYKDSLSNLAKLTTIEDFIDYDEQVRQQVLATAEEEYQDRIRTNTFLGSSFTLMVIAFLLYRNNRAKQKSKEKIEKAYDKLKSTQTQLIHSEKMASLGELTAGIAHEIQNPLNFVNNFSEINNDLLDDLKIAIAENDQEEIDAIYKDLKENESKVTHHGKRAEGIVKSMLQHSRTGSGEKELTDINALADEYLRLAYHGFRAKDQSFNADFKTEFDEKLPKIEVVPQDIGRVLLNLINNAFQAVKDVDKPHMTISTKTNPPSKGGARGFVEIRVKDNGPGIPDDIKEKIFQPFFTTKPTGEGTGLGLSMSYDIVTKGHGGTIEVKSVQGEGTEFIVELSVG